MSNKNFENVSTWWNDRSIELVKIDGEVYALHGWNGESFLDCWKCEDEFTASSDNKEYTVTPVYSNKLNRDELYDIIEYKVSVN